MILSGLLTKHTPADFVKSIKKEVFNQEEIIQLRDKTTGELLDKYSTVAAIRDENEIAKVIGYLKGQSRCSSIGSAPEGLSDEQKKAYYRLIEGKGFSVLQGYAGTGKSYVLKAVSDAYEKMGVKVYAIGADSGAASALQEKGLEAVNMHTLMYRDRFQDSFHIPKGSVIMLDEAGKLTNKNLLEFLRFAWRHRARVIWSGDHAQFDPVGRGGMGTFLAQSKDAVTLTEVRRQVDNEESKVVMDLAKGEVDKAIDTLHERKQIHFSDTRMLAIHQLAQKWAEDHQDGKANHEKSIIITATNREAHVLNEVVRGTRLTWGNLSAQDEVRLKTSYGHLYFAKGDLIAFRENDSGLGVHNGLRGTVLCATEDEVAVEVNEGEKNRFIRFDPKEYRKFHHGYAINANFSQGGTWDRTYALVASWIGRKMFYVIASRHTKQFDLFAARSEISGLAKLKMARESGFFKKSPT